MWGLHISLMSAPRDRQQNPRMPRCLISMGNIKLINPLCFPLTEPLAAVVLELFPFCRMLWLCRAQGLLASLAGLCKGMGPFC